MLFLDLQMRLARGWYDVAEAGARTLGGAYLDAGRDLSQAWLAAMQTKPPEPKQYAFPFAAEPAPLNPFWPPAFAGSWPGGSGFRAFVHPHPAVWLTGFWPLLWSPSPAERQPSLFDAFPASYRTAGGHASAPIVAPLQTPVAAMPWWPWPQPGRPTMH